MTTMEVTSYLILVVYIVSFAGLTAASAKLSGQPPWFLANAGRSGGALGLAYLVALAGAVVWPLAQSSLAQLRFADPIRATLDGFGEDLVGHMLMGLGAAIGMVSQMHASQLWRFRMDDKEDTAEARSVRQDGAFRQDGTFMQDGPFAVSRNPIFLGQLLLFSGLFLVVPNIIQAGLTIVLIVSILLQVRIEERTHLARFGEPYRQYCARVRRWLGTRTGTARSEIG